MSNDKVIDKGLQKKYIEAVKHINEIFVGSDGDFKENFAVQNLIPQPSILVGPPGVGKTTLVRLIGKVFFEDRVGVINVNETVRPEDVIYDTDVKLIDNSSSEHQYKFEPMGRPFMSSAFALINEANRANKPLQNAFLSIFSEGTIVIKGKTLTKNRGKVWLDFNPYYGSLDLAFVDRMVGSTYLGEIDLFDQLKLMREKYGSEKHVSDLVSLAKPMLKVSEMEAIWEDVKKVKFDEGTYANALLFLNVFRACKFELGSADPMFVQKLDCANCTFSQTCLTKQLEHPVLQRSLDHFVNIAKAIAYFKGRDEVNLQEDAVPAVRQIMLHRVSVKPQYKDAHPTINHWYEDEVVPLFTRLIEYWKNAKKVYDEVQRNLAAKNLSQAVKVYQDFVDICHDITSYQMVHDLLGKKIESELHSDFQKLLIQARTMRNGKLEYKKNDIDKLEKEASKFLPEQKRKIEKEVNFIRAKFSNRISVKTQTFKKLMIELSLKFPSDTQIQSYINGNNRPNGSMTLNDGTTLSMSPTGSSVEIQYDAVQNSTAEILNRYTTMT